MMLRLFIVIILLISYQSGYSKKKETNFNITIYFPDRVISNPNYGKYISQYSYNEYLSAFREGFMKIIIKEDILVVEASDTISKDPPRPLFLINLSGLKLNEEKIEQEIKDSCGRVIEKYTCISCSAGTEMIITESGKDRILKKRYISNGKSEEVNTKRNVIEVLIGVKQGHGTPHLKELSENVFLKSCRKSGTQAARQSLKIIHRALRKQGRIK